MEVERRRARDSPPYLGFMFRSGLSDLGVRKGLGLSTQGIRPFEIWEACEIGIGGVEGVATFDGEGGEVGIGGQIASGAERF